jgi:hypothetical protein
MTALLAILIFHLYNRNSQHQLSDMIVAKDVIHEWPSISREGLHYTHTCNASFSHTTTMSNIPTPKEIPPTPEQVDQTLQSVLAAAQKLISSNPQHFANLHSSFLAMYTHLTVQLILGIPSQVSTNPPPSKQSDPL